MSGPGVIEEVSEPGAIEDVSPITREQLLDAVGVADWFNKGHFKDFKELPPVIYAGMLVAGSINRLAEVQASDQKALRARLEAMMESISRLAEVQTSALPETLSLLESIDITMSEIAGLAGAVRRVENAGETGGEVAR